MTFRRNVIFRATAVPRIHLGKVVGSEEQIHRARPDPLRSCASSSSTVCARCPRTVRCIRDDDEERSRRRAAYEVPVNWGAADGCRSCHSTHSTPRWWLLSLAASRIRSRRFGTHRTVKRARVSVGLSGADITVLDKTQGRTSDLERVEADAPARCR